MVWSVTYSYINDDGVSRGKDEFYATMIFYQSGNRKNALSGSGVEIDDVYDEKGEVEDSQTLEFTWYIDNNGDIYIRYAKSGATFVLDAVLARRVSIWAKSRAETATPSMVI